jgi:hypothetical protein
MILSLWSGAAVANEMQEAFQHCADKAHARADEVRERNIAKADGDAKQLAYLNQMNASDLGVLLASCKMWRSTCENDRSGDMCTFFIDANRSAESQMAPSAAPPE